MTFIIEEFITQQGFSSDTDCFSVDGVLRYCSFDEQHFDAHADNPYTPRGLRMAVHSCLAWAQAEAEGASSSGSSRCSVSASVFII